MIAELRQQGGPKAIMAIQESLAEIEMRQQHGLLTDEMIVHRSRLLHLMEQIQDAKTKEQCGLAVDYPLIGRDCNAEQER
jgi:hypothetical protein